MHHYLHKLIAVTLLVCLGFTAKAQDPTVICLPEGDLTAGCSQFVSAFCSTFETTVTFNPDDTGSRCFNLPATSSTSPSCIFTVGNGGDAAGAPSPDVDQCSATVNAVLSECDFGGIGEFPGATFGFAVAGGSDGCPALVQD